MIKLQLQQREHDLRVHRDILALSASEQIQRHALHLCTCAGRVAEGRALMDDTLLAAEPSTLVDAAIACLAMANALGHLLNFDAPPEVSSDSASLCTQARRVASQVEEWEYDQATNAPESLLAALDHAMGLICNMHPAGRALIGAAIKERWAQTQSVGVFAWPGSSSSTDVPDHHMEATA